MTFQSPWWLLLLLGPIGIAVAYVLVQRLRSRTTVRFTSVELLASVAPRRPGWQRHVSAVGMVAALTVIALAVAGPLTTKRVPLDRATIVLTLDTSASMMADDISPSRLAAAQQQARSFVTDLPEDLQVGLVSFDSQARALVAPTTNHTELERAIDSLQVGSGTATAAGISTALAQIEAQPKTEDGRTTPAAIVVMSDGSPTLADGEQSPVDAALAAATTAKDAGVPVYTIAFGTPDGTVQIQGQTIPVPFDPDTMAALAEAGGGRSYTAETADELRTVYDEIGRDVAYEEQPFDLTPLFAGVGLVTALLACAAALYWNQRVV